MTHIADGAEAKATITPASAKSYRMHAKRYGTFRAASNMRAKGYALGVALEVLCGRMYVRERLAPIRFLEELPRRVRQGQPTYAQVAEVIDAAEATGMPLTALRWAIHRLCQR